MKGIQWIKLATYMCEDEKMRLIDAMDNIRDPAYYVWIRLLLQAGKVNDNGLIYLKEDVPYTNEMLSIIFNRPLSIIEEVLKIFEDFKMIEIYENNIIKITNWEKHQNIEGMKRVREKTRGRVKEFREKKKIESELEENKEIQISKKSRGNGKSKEANQGELKEDINDSKRCNTNVTQQREKREIDIKKKNKNLDKEEREKEDKLDEKASHVNMQVQRVIKYLEDTKVNIKGLTIKWLIEVLGIHEEIYVKMAINAAMKRNKFDICYISGILKNWLIEGYPKTYEEMEFESSKEKANLKFNNFKPREYDYDDLEKRLLGWKT